MLKSYQDCELSEIPIAMKVLSDNLHDPSVISDEHLYIAYTKLVGELLTLSFSQNRSSYVTGVASTIHRKTEVARAELIKTRYSNKLVPQSECSMVE